MSALHASVDLVPHMTAARTARRSASELLLLWSVPSGLVEDIALVVSELVTNAVQHAHQDAPMELVLTLTDQVVRVSLSDGSPDHPRRREASATDEGGRGMAIVDALADRWGVAPQPVGKCIWFEIDLQQPRVRHGARG